MNWLPLLSIFLLALLINAREEIPQYIRGALKKAQNFKVVFEKLILI